MSWSDKVFRYCERGADPAFWAEPLNAVSNAAFILAGLAAAIELVRRRESFRPAELGLTALVIVIGIGSFLFHTVATRWASLADIIPIGLFMLAYMGYAVKVLLKQGWLVTIAGLALFMGALYLAGEVQCRPALLPVTAAARGPCLNGTVGYLPAFAAMIGIGTILALLRHPAAWLLLSAGAVFLVSMTFRTIDFEVCALTRVMGRSLGTHVLWHLCNAMTLYLLLVAAIRHGRPAAA